MSYELREGERTPNQMPGRVHGLNVDDLSESLSLWRLRLPAFTPSHARYGAMLAKIIIDGIETPRGEFIAGLGALRPTTAYDLALDIAWVFWLDDCFDSHPTSSSDSYMQLTDLMLDEDHSESLEVWSAALIRSSIGVDAPNAAWTRWMTSIVDMVNAFQTNKRKSRKPDTSEWTYDEYIVNGEVSSAIPHFFTTVAMSYGCAVRDLDDPRVRDLLHHLSLAMRLENDLVSYEKEIKEGDMANAVLLIAQHIDLQDACSFVESQRQGHENHVLRLCAELGEDSLLARAALLILEGAHWLHHHDRARYERSDDATNLTH